MAWGLASFILQITYLTETIDIIRNMEEVEPADFLSLFCSNDLVAQAVEQVTLDLYKPEVGSLVISIIFCVVCILLWLLIWHANANLVLEQRDLIEEHFPPEG